MNLLISTKIEKKIIHFSLNDFIWCFVIVLILAEILDLFRISANKLFISQILVTHSLHSIGNLHTHTHTHFNTLTFTSFMLISNGKLNHLLVYNQNLILFELVEITNSARIQLFGFCWIFHTKWWIISFSHEIESTMNQFFGLTRKRKNKNKKKQ